jgi:hypothetical protein
LSRRVRFKELRVILSKGPGISLRCRGNSGCTLQGSWNIAARLGSKLYSPGFLEYHCVAAGVASYTLRGSWYIAALPRELGDILSKGPGISLRCRGNPSHTLQGSSNITALPRELRVILSKVPGISLRCRGNCELYSPRVMEYRCFAAGIASYTLQLGNSKVPGISLRCWGIEVILSKVPRISLHCWGDRSYTLRGSWNITSLPREFKSYSPRLLEDGFVAAAIQV